MVSSVMEIPLGFRLSVAREQSFVATGKAFN